METDYTKMYGGIHAVKAEGEKSPILYISLPSKKRWSITIEICTAAVILLRRTDPDAPSFIHLITIPDASHGPAMLV